MYKVFVCALLAAASAAPAGEATSYTSFNDNHNSIHHIQSAQAHYSAPAQYSVPARYSAPAQYPAPTQYSTPAQYPAPVQYSTPVQYSAPVIAKVAVTPAVPSYYHSAATPIITKRVIATAVAKSAPTYHEEEYPAGPAKYAFAYTIADPHTGDYHSQEEKRDGDHVVGQYSLQEADGTTRIVKYFDEGHGFNAVVERQGHPSEAPVAYKKVVAAAIPQYSAYH